MFLSNFLHEVTFDLNSFLGKYLGFFGFWAKTEQNGLNNVSAIFLGKLLCEGFWAKSGQNWPQTEVIQVLSNVSAWNLFDILCEVVLAYRAKIEAIDFMDRAGKIRFFGARQSVLLKASSGERCAPQKFLHLLTFRGTQVYVIVYLAVHQMKYLKKAVNCWLELLHLSYDKVHGSVSDKK